MRRISQFKQSLIQRIPVLGRLQRALYRYKPYRCKFRTYYLDRAWGDGESVSGPGSSLAATAAIRRALPDILRQFEIRSLIDAPCGDFHWMKEVDLSGVDYLGIDIVKELVDANSERYARHGVRFVCRDLISDPIGHADLIICRDCLFYFTNSYIKRSTLNFKKTGSNTTPLDPTNCQAVLFV
jgi:hypothetical protein